MTTNWPDKEIGPDSRVLVVGLGRSGIAAAKLLKKRGAVIRCADSAHEDKVDLRFREWAEKHEVQIECGGNGEVLEGDDLIVVSPGVPLNIPVLASAREKGVPVIGELSLAASLVTKPMVAITGTNGKSTVTELVGEMFRKAGRKVFVGGNLGVPLSEYLLDPIEVDILVLEVSSFQLDTAPDFRPEVGVLLNISPDHLDRYEGFDHYAASKFSIFGAQKGIDAAVLNADDLETMVRLGSQALAARVYFFGQELAEGVRGVKIDGQQLKTVGFSSEREESFSLTGSELGQEPNIHNTAASICAALLLDCPVEAIRKAITEFKSLGHRLEQLIEKDGVLYIDDSKATNIGALNAALTGMAGSVVLIAGGRDKGGDYRVLREVIAQKVKAMVLIGEAKGKMAEAFSDIVRVEVGEDMGDAVELAAEIADVGDTVLLSPACASFDMFESYGHRGRAFRDAVLAL